MKEQSTAMRLMVLFVRVRARAYNVGYPGMPVLFEPRENGWVGVEMLHAMAECRGMSIDITHLLPPGRRENPRACAWNAIGRALRQIENTSPALGAALAGFTLRTDGDRVIGKLQARAHGVRIETQNP